MSPVARAGVLAAILAAAIGAAVLTFHGLAVPVGAVFLSAVSLVLAGGVAFLHLRDVGLSTVTVLAPLLGMALLAPLAAEVPVSALIAVYALGSVAAQVAAGEMVRHLLANRERDAAMVATVASGWIAIVATAVAVSALSIAWIAHRAVNLASGMAGESVAAVLAASIFVPLAASLLPLGESFFVAINRAREKRERWLQIAMRVTESRWGLSLSGAALVLAVLGWFGAAPLLGHSALLDQPLLWAASALGIFLIALAVARDWREALAAVLALAALTLLSLWLWGHASGRLTLAAFVEIVAVVASALFVMLLLADMRRVYRQSGDDAATARLRALDALGTAPWFGAGCAAAALLPWIVVHGSIVTLAAMFAAAGVAAVLIQPAIATALERALPRRRSLDQLYGRG